MSFPRNRGSVHERMKKLCASFVPASCLRRLCGTVRTGILFRPGRRRRIRKCRHGLLAVCRVYVRRRAVDRNVRVEELSGVSRHGSALREDSVFLGEPSLLPWQNIIYLVVWSATSRDRHWTGTRKTCSTLSSCRSYSRSRVQLHSHGPQALQIRPGAGHLGTGLPGCVPPPLASAAR